MILAIINGLITSVILETFILMKQDFSFQKALKTALGMSFISMITMEIVMNLLDWFLTGGAILIWWIIFFSLLPVDVDRNKKNFVEGVDPGAPENPKLIKKLI